MTPTVAATPTLPSPFATSVVAGLYHSCPARLTSIEAAVHAVGPGTILAKDHSNEADIVVGPGKTIVVDYNPGDTLRAANIILHGTLQARCLGTAPARAATT